VSNETQKPDGAAEAVEAGGTFAERVTRLSDDQLQAVRQTVLSEAEKREQPNYGGMTDQEFRKDVSKRFGFSPKV
jgi:hypothetical protein